MNHAQEPQPPQQDPEDAELLHARALLARTMRFLARCAEDPEEALRTEDPRELIRELEVLGFERETPKAAPSDAPLEPRTIPIQRRRSA